MKGSPYTPGAGHTPPVLAGREELLRDWHLVLNDVVSAGRVRAQDMILAGPRGVGKTVTVSAFADLAMKQGFEVVNLQAVSGHAGLVESLLQRARTRIGEEAGPWQRARKAFERIGGVNLSIAGIGAGISSSTLSPGRTMWPALAGLTPATLARPSLMSAAARERVMPARAQISTSSRAGPSAVNSICRGILSSPPDVLP